MIVITAILVMLLMVIPIILVELEPQVHYDVVEGLMLCYTTLNNERKVIKLF